MAIRSLEGRTPSIGKNVYIDETALVVGDVVIGDDSSVWPFVAARGDVNAIRIGARTNIQDGSVLHVTHDGPYTPGGIPLLVGDDVTAGHRVVLHACTVGSRCLIGMAAVLMDGVTVEDDVLVAAGTLATPGMRLESGHLYRGSPARKARALTDAEREMLRYSAQHYVRLKDRYLIASD